MAAMVDHINKERKDHIITLEDPIEYVFTPAGCQVSQREIGNNSQSFSSALRASLREDPDVIMVGEMRDLETISLAITASETGHLVLGTCTRAPQRERSTGCWMCSRSTSRRRSGRW